MKRVRGFLIIEIILASALFGMFIVSLGSYLVFGQLTSAQAGMRNRGSLLLNECIEVVKDIAVSDFASLNPGNYGLLLSGGLWNMNPGSENIDIYTRQITITDINTDHKELSCNVIWDEGTNWKGDIRAVTRFANAIVEIAPASCDEYCELQSYKNGSCKRKIKDCKGKKVYESDGDPYCFDLKKTVCCCKP